MDVEHGVEGGDLNCAKNNKNQHVEGDRVQKRKGVEDIVEKRKGVPDIVERESCGKGLREYCVEEEGCG
jgi:hypothetical protein